MSYAIRLNIWFETEDYLNTYLAVLTGFDRAWREHRGSSSQFLRVQSFDQPLSKVDDFTPGADHFLEVRSYLERSLSESHQVSIDSVYPYLDYEDDIDQLVAAVRPVTIRFNGPDYMQGHYQRRFGLIEISFDNIGSFMLPDLLITRVAQASTIETKTKRLSMISRIERNYDFVREVIRAVVSEARPRHLLSCTESDVNPLVSHDVYHSRLEDFAADLRKIAQLHEYGGLYFCDVEPHDRAFVEPWKQSGYGYWRGLYGKNDAQQFIDRLQPYIDWLLKDPESEKLSSTTIQKCLFSSLDTFTEKLGSGYLISCRASSSDFIEDPYFCLYQQLNN